MEALIIFARPLHYAGAAETADADAPDPALDGAATAPMSLLTLRCPMSQLQTSQRLLSLLLSHRGRALLTELLAVRRL